MIPTELCLPILCFKEFRIMPLPCLDMYRCLINVKENLPSLSVRKYFQQYTPQVKIIC